MLPEVLGFCRYGELPRINRQNTVCSPIVTCLLHNTSYEVYQEVGCLSTDGLTRRADIIVIDHQKELDIVLDPTIRFEINEQQPLEVCHEKQNIY